MKAHDIFNFRRFGKYFASDAKTCAANFGLTLATTSLLPSLAAYVLAVGFNLLFLGSWTGPGIGLRFGIFIVSLVFMLIGMPVNCYGKITQKQYGTFWLNLPASRLEKYLSMIIMSCIIVPVIGITGFLAADSLVCTLDSTCGQSLFRAALALKENAVGFVNDLYSINVDLDIHMGAASFPLKDFPEGIRQLASPWYYIDDFFGMVLPFLFGAVFFKSHKVVKTILLLAAISTVTSLGISPFLKDMIYMFSGMDEQQAVEFLMNGGIFRKLMIMDTISDTVMNVGFLTAIWFRIKTLKH